MRMRFRRNGKWRTKMLVPAMGIVISFVGCATAPMETHRKGMESLTEKEYFIPKKPIDRSFIGCAWSKQFGPIEDPSAADIRIKVERSFDAMQQNFAYNAGISLGARSIKGVSTKGDTAELGVEGGKERKSKLENVQIISPVSLADVPFEPNIPYITEALRLGDFALRSESTGKAGITVEVSSVKGGIKGTMEDGGGTSGQGLVVAYKLHMIDPRTYSKQDSGSVSLALDKTVDFPRANLFVRSELKTIEVGANRPLPRSLLWACDRAEAASKDAVAAWVIEVRPKEAKRKPLQIAFPAFPRIEDCQSFSGVIFSRIDPLTDKIIRQKINITVIQEELSDSLKPKQWEAQVSLVDESFKIKLVKQDDLGKE